MDKNKDVQIINNLFDNPKNINNNIIEIENLLNKYKKDIVENKYTLLIGDNEITIKLFIIFLFYYDLQIKNVNTTINKKFHVGIDLEFNLGKIALMQLNFGKYLWIIDPRKYDNTQIQIIINKLLLNEKIYKIFHGADSLDLPYIFSELLKNDQIKILKFMKKFIDTRFLCEYVRISKKEDGKCSIYDAMLYFGTITKNKYDELQKNNELMGPIQDVMWDINKLSSFHIKYAFYDVLHLLTFLNNIYKKIIYETPELVRTYYYIMEIIRFVILERKEITNVLNSSREIVNPLNNHLIKLKDGNSTLLNVYNDLIENFVIVDVNDKGTIDLNFIEKLNYVRGTFSFLLKHIVYYVCYTKYEVYKNKNEILSGDIVIDKLYNELNKIKMYKIVKLLKLFEIEVNKRLDL
mgnify:CR=1 FL=1